MKTDNNVTRHPWQWMGMKQNFTKELTTYWKRNKLKP